MSTASKQPAFSVRAEGQAAEIRIYGVIGDPWEDGVTAAEFARQVAALGQVDTIHLRINSPGGSVFDALAIYSVLHAHPARVVVDIDGAALSAATIVMLAGDEIRAAAGALLMLHGPRAGSWGTANEHRDVAAMLDKVHDQLVAVYQARTGASAESVAAWLSADTWFTAAEAQAAGLVTSVTQSKAVAAFGREQLARLGIQPAPTALEQLEGLCPPPLPEEPSMATAAPVTPAAPAQPAVAPPVPEARTSAPQAGAAIDVEQVRAEAVKTERDRVAQIHALCKTAGLVAMADELVAGGQSVEQARVVLFERLCLRNQAAGSAGAGDAAGAATPAADGNDKYRAEYKADAAEYQAAGLSEADYIKSRRLDDGLDVLRPKPPAA